MFLHGRYQLIRKSVFSKSLVLAFVLQIFAASMCVSFANASEQVMPKNAHCHSQNMMMDTQHSSSSMTSCTHCDVLDMDAALTSLSNVDTLDTGMLAINIPESLCVRHQAPSWVQQRAPPQPLERPLYLTTQRIRI